MPQTNEKPPSVERDGLENLSSLSGNDGQADTSPHLALESPNSRGMAVIAAQIDAALASMSMQPAEDAAGHQDRDKALESSNEGDLTEDGQALLFAAQNRDVRYVNPWSCWMCWHAGKWRHEKTLAVFDRIRKQVRAATEDAKPGLRVRLRRARSIAAIEQLARSDRRLAATTEQWDSDDLVLNTPGGVVDLKTGVIRPHQLDDYCTKITAAAPEGECPQWMAFLDQIFDNDYEIIYYIQNVLGYCLTGSNL